jgi:hypothetical protein
MTNDLTGQKFGRLVVRAEVKKRKHGSIAWRCICDCGKHVIVTGCHLRSKNSPTISCGCAKRERIIALAPVRLKVNLRHGHARWDTKSSVYNRWTAMISRCTDPNHNNGKAWKNYGGRGIKVCRRWRNSFEAFLADMGEPPEGDYLLDRKNNNKNYTPGNCRWATRAESIKNQRSHGRSRA